MTRERVIETARHMIEEGGVEALSMRKLAAELGVAPTGIYWHVGGREQLLTEIVDEVVDEMADLRPTGATARDRMASVARQIRRQVLDHPYLVELARELGQGPATAFPGQVALAREATAAGLQGEEGADAVRALLWLVGGFVMLERLPQQPDQPVQRTTTQELWKSVRDTDIDASLAKAMTRVPDPDTLFETSLQSLLDAVVPASATVRKSSRATRRG
ncbi:MAG TPA: TetR family transcriptional regulator [Acidimicrobiales bacterium]|nr:TetR family transcriptional regulator [Acidimicrobiales bacterium]